MKIGQVDGKVERPQFQLELGQLVLNAPEKGHPTCLVNSLKPVAHTNNCKIFLKPLSSGLHANCFLQLYQSGVDKSQLQWSLGHVTNII